MAHVRIGAGPILAFLVVGSPYCLGPSSPLATSFCGGFLGRSAEEHYHRPVMYGEEIFHHSICHGILSTPCLTEPFASRPMRSLRN